MNIQLPIQIAKQLTWLGDFPGGAFDAHLDLAHIYHIHIDIIIENILVLFL